MRYEVYSTKIILAIAAIITLISLCGCTAFLAGAGTVGLGMDTVRLERYVDYETAWEATLSALNNIGALVASGNKDQGIIIGTIDRSKIKINVYQVGKEPAAINISVRKKGLPDLKTADEILKVINTQFSQKKTVEQDA